jgi:hypothetical protein
VPPTPCRIEGYGVPSLTRAGYVRVEAGVAPIGTARKTPRRLRLDGSSVIVDGDGVGDVGGRWPQLELTVDAMGKVGDHGRMVDTPVHESDFSGPAVKVCVMVAAHFLAEMCSVEEKVWWDAWAEKMRVVNHAIRMNVEQATVPDSSILTRSVWVRPKGRPWCRRTVGTENHIFHTRPGQHCYLCSADMRYVKKRARQIYCRCNYCFQWEPSLRGRVWEYLCMHCIQAWPYSLGQE